MKTLNKTSLKLVTVLALLPLMGFQTAKVKAKQATSLPAPSVVLNYADGATVPRTSYVVLSAKFAYASGLQSFSMSGGFSGGSANCNGATTAGGKLYFFNSYFAPGDYAFKVTATGVDGHVTTKTITLHSK